jgi:hypothetical protein
MTNAPALRFPIDDHLARMDPVFFHSSGVYVKTQRESHGTSFVTTRGVVHPLRLLLPADDFNNRFKRRNAAGVRDYLQAERNRVRTSEPMKELEYFVGHLVPAFDARDYSASFPLAVIALGDPPPSHDDQAGVIDSLASQIPAAALPVPSVLMLGRFCRLRLMKSRGTTYYIRHEDQLLEPTGEESPVAVIESCWRVEAGVWLRRALARVAEYDSDRPRSAALTRALSEINRSGFFQSGDLLFFPGSPPKVGHILPPHYNRALGRACQRDLAMVAPLQFPPRVGQPHVYTKTCDGRWIPLPLRHGLCLGPSPPESRPESPGLTLLAFLRWAAARIAANGMFHASDEDDYTAYDS